MIKHDIFEFKRSEEVVLADGTVALVRLAEPLPDASHVELVLASLARHFRQTLVSLMHHAVAYVAVLNAFDLPLNIGLPGQHSRDDISILDLYDLPDGQYPLSELLLRNLDLAAHVNLDQLHGVLCGNLDPKSHFNFSLREVSKDLLCRFVELEGKFARA